MIIDINKSYCLNMKSSMVGSWPLLETMGKGDPCTAWATVESRHHQWRTPAWSGI